MVIVDQGSNNQKMANKYLKVTENEPFFIRDGQKIFFMYDPPHLLKSIRNNLVGREFYFNEELVASWAHFAKLIELDTAAPTAFRLAPKLTVSRHGNPTAFKKMKVRTAAQTFSSTTAAAMTTYAVSSDSSMPVGAASTTAATFKKLDNLFDCFNSTNIYADKPFKAALTKDSIHHDFLIEMRDFFSGLQALEIRPDRKSYGKFSRPPCFKGWVLSINSLLQFWASIVDVNGVYYLKTRRLNQDCLENLFSVIRRLGCDRDNPTVKNFRDTLRHVTVSIIRKVRIVKLT
jgi:hypothetical protein